LRGGGDTITNPVTINGVTWATANVARPGYFASSETDSGMFYQWNRNVGWSATDPLTDSNGGTTWDSTLPSGTEWESANDPSPAGFHVPTQAEFYTLFDTTYVTSSWVTGRNGTSVNGRLFTDIATGNTLFFPSVGRRTNSGVVQNGINGYYWTSELSNVADYAISVFFYSSGGYAYNWNTNGGSSIRPIMD